MIGRRRPARKALELAAVSVPHHLKHTTHTLDDSLFVPKRHAPPMRAARGGAKAPAFTQRARLAHYSRGHGVA